MPFHEIFLFSHQGHIQEEMQGLFTNLYRPRTDRSTPSTTSVQVTVGRIQDNVATVMHSLDPGLRGLGKGTAYPRQPTIPEPGPSVAFFNNRGPLLRSSPYPSYNQRQTYFASRSTRPRSIAHSTAPRASRSQGPTGRKFTRTVVVMDSLYDNVPRGALRQELHHKGLVSSKLCRYMDKLE